MALLGLAGDVLHLDGLVVDVEHGVHVVDAVLVVAVHVGIVARALISLRGELVSPCGHVFERLVPFWKLQCYFVKNGKPDFYPDLYEKMRRSEEEHPELAKLSRSENVVPFQLNFVRGASEVAGINLYPYFEAFGFFRLLKLTYGDYGTYHYHLTAEMRDAFKAEMDQMVRDGKLRALTDAELQAMLHAEE